MPCLRSHVTTTTQQWCLNVCLVFTPGWDVVVVGGGHSTTFSRERLMRVKVTRLTARPSGKARHHVAVW